MASASPARRPDRPATVTSIRRPSRRGAGGTVTSAFGVGRRENHDASGFYERFSAPDLSTDEVTSPPSALDTIFVGDAGDMDAAGDVADGSVALVVTSPPYFAGKAYEEELGQRHIPASYLEYLEMLRGVFAECVRKLEPGGRIAVNVANLGRKPYRSLSSDLVGILQDDLGLLLRGEVIWRKAEGAGGNCAWGSYRSGANPVLRDVTERIVIASKGRFDRARSRRQRAAEGLPHRDTLTAEEFMAATLDVWDLPPESATRVGHPAPFPVSLPRRCIELYTYYGDLVLDPFMGSGSTAVAAVRTGRRFVGFDTDPGFVEAATARVDHERSRLVGVAPSGGDRGGARAREVARELLESAGFELDGDRPRRAHGIEVDFVVHDGTGGQWLVDVTGGFVAGRTGLRRADTLWRALGRAAVLSMASPPPKLLFLSTDLPARNSAGDKALRAVRGAGRPVFDALDLGAATTPDSLAIYAAGAEQPIEPFEAGANGDAEPLDGFGLDPDAAR